MGVHPCIEGAFHILLECVGAHGDNGDFLRALFTALSDFPGSRKTVHYRHLDIHQNQIIIPNRPFQIALQRFLSVLPAFHLKIVAAQQCLGNLRVEIIVLRQKDSFSL